MPHNRMQRKDAARNRERLLAAASKLFTSRGLEVTLNDVAHHAGVGVGTAYRNFANKGEVIRALFADRLAEMIVRAEAAVLEEDAWTGLVGFLEDSLRAKRDDRALAELLTTPDVGRDLADQARDRLGALVNTLVHRAQEQGTVRADMAGTDTVFLEIALGAVMRCTNTVEPDLYRRLLAIFLDGMRTRDDNSLLSPTPLSLVTTHRIVSGHTR